MENLTKSEIIERYKERYNNSKCAADPECEKVDLTKITLTGDDTDFKESNLTKANFKDSILDGADFTKSNLTKADFTNSILNGAVFTMSNLNEADFSFSELRGARFTEFKDLSEFTPGSYSKTNFEKTSFYLAKLLNAKFIRADLKNVDFRYSRLKEADLRGANLTGADLSNAIIRGADLTKANLTNANLTKANLEGADLTGADLKGANFKGAIVKDIILYDVKNLEKAKNLHLNRTVVETREEMTIVIRAHGTSPLNFFLVPENVNINTKSDVGTVCFYDFFKSKNFVLLDPDWIEHNKGNIIPDFLMSTKDAGNFGKLGIYVLKGGPLTCDDYEFINNMNLGNKKNFECKDNNDDFLRITFDKILLSDLIKGLKEKFQEVKINIYDISCNELVDLNSAKQIQCFNLTGDLSKKTTPTKTVTTLKDGGLKRLSWIGYEDDEDKSIKYRTDHTENQDFSAFREYDYSKEIKEIIKNQSLLTKEGKEKMGRMLTEPFNMKDVCFLLVCVYLFVKNKGNENKEQLFKDIKTNTKEQETYKYKLKNFFNFSSSFSKKFALRANDILPSAKFFKFGRRRSQRKIKRRIYAKRRSIRRSRIDAKRRLRSIKKRGVST